MNAGSIVTLSSLLTLHPLELATTGVYKEAGKTVGGHSPLD